ncbi:hypothetical protein [Brachybacterium tyrofermentans]|uniref:hypothetical protein n=1 Tax=Brachybacterium tyrofermentans TaxID=47848 RepID=UPI003FD18C45
MDPVTPAQLALELGVSSHDVREVLRGTYGTLTQQNVTLKRWQLTTEQTQLVRDRFSENHRDPLVWSLEPGETVRRTELQATYGGSRQDGIVTSSVTTDILIFTDPIKGAKYGYDLHDGLKADGTYTYTGAGGIGDQQFARGNKALRDSVVEGRVIRLFLSKGVDVTYEGAFTTGDPAYTLQQAPDTTGAQRQVIVFNLLPLGKRGDSLPLKNADEVTAAPTTTNWTPPDSSDITISADDDYVAKERVVTRVEHDLQAAFGAWLQTAGNSVLILKLPTSAGSVEPDLYVPDRGWIVEAKKSTGRTYVRMAIGQVLDYAYLARKNQLKAVPVILLPGEPEGDLKQLISDLGITLATRTSQSFTITEPTGS